MTSRFLSGLLLALSIALFVSACGTERGSPQRQEPIEATSQAFSVTEDGGTPGSSCGTMGGMCGKPTCTTGIGTLTFADSTPAGAPVTNIQLTLGGSECAGETFTARLNGLLLGTGLKFASNTCACNACTTQTLDFPFPAGNPNYNKGGPNSITILPTPAGGLCLATIAATITGPQAVGVAPPSGPTSGGTLVTITGTDFPAGTPAITFGGVAGTSPTRVGATSMTVVTPANPLGAVSIVITYPGGASQTLTNAFTYLVNPSTPTIVQDVNPTVFGQLVTFTVNVSGGGPTPTGTVSFYNASGPILLGTASLDGGGNAAFAFGALPVGTDSVYATYNGDGYYNPATSASTMHTVNQASTTVALMSSVNPTVFGQTTTFTATVAPTPPGAGTPTGTVDFLDGVMVMTAGVALSGGMAQWTVPGLSVGMHSITARYNAATNFAASVSSAVVQTVNKADTAVALGSSVNPTVAGGQTTLTAAVSAKSPGAGTPSGMVTFLDGALPIGVAALSGGVAAFPTASSSVGMHSITAVYGGDGSFNPGTSPAVIQVVNPDTASVALGTSVNPSVFGGSVTFTATVTPTTMQSGVPAGTVTFISDGVAMGSSGLSGSGVATFTTTTLTGGTHSITAFYGGDTNHTVATSPTLMQTVNATGTSTVVSSATKPSVFGQSVTFSATVTSSVTGTITGTVSFRDAGVPIGMGTLNGAGVATFSTSALSVASHTITGVYLGDSNYTTSASAGISQVVNAADTTTTVISSSNPSGFGGSVTFTATVAAAAPGSGTPTGTVSFLDGGLALAGTVSLNGAGIAALTTAALAVGPHAITVAYAGSGSFNASTSATLNQVVSKDGVTMTLAASQNPSVYGGSVTFTATVVTPPPGTVASGTVTFANGGTTIGVASLDVNGVATFLTAALPGGTNSITATYGGDANHGAGASASVSEVVNAATSTVAVASDNTPSVFGQPVTFTASVTSAVAGSPTGTVAFMDGSTMLRTAAVNGAGIATYVTGALPVGSHSVTAVYSGDPNYATSTSPILVQVVGKAATTCMVTSASNPSSLGAAVPLTATVSATAPGAGTPSGMVTFEDGTSVLGTAALDSNGQATFSANGLTLGMHAITVTYPGDGDFTASSSLSLSETVNPYSPLATLTATPNPSKVTQPVVFTATLVGEGGAPTGGVVFTDSFGDGGADGGDGAATLGATALDGGVATLSVSTLGVGTHPVTAHYSGDGLYASQTATVVQVVNKADTTTTLKSAPNPSNVGQPVTLTATVMSAAPALAGTVEFDDGTMKLGTGMLDANGIATLMVVSLSSGGHVIAAAYGGDGSHAASTSGSLMQSVGANGADGGVGVDSGTGTGSPDSGAASDSSSDSGAASDSSSDSGAASDSSSDSGAPSSEAGPDATVGAAGPDAGANGSFDAGAGSGDGGSLPVGATSNGGCGCSAASREASVAELLGVVALLGLGLRRRRTPQTIAQGVRR